MFLRQAKDFRHRNIVAGQGFHHPVFAVHLMGRFQKRSGRLGAQHVFSAVGFHPVGRIGLAGVEFLDRMQTGKSRHKFVQLVGERFHVKGVVFHVRHP